MPFMNLLAYVDPGAGSLLVQALIGGLLAGLYAIKLYWTKLKLGLKDWFKQKPPPR